MTRFASFQGTQLSAAQRRLLEFQRRTRAAFLNPVLSATVDDTIRALEERAKQPQDDPYRYRLETARRGTPWVGDAFGY